MATHLNMQIELKILDERFDEKALRGSAQDGQCTSSARQRR